MGKPLHLLSFLGTGKYYETTYVWREQRITTRFAPVASACFLQPSRITMLLTEEAKEQVPDLLREIEANLPSGVEIGTYSIPLGRDEAELWDLFDRIVDAVIAPGEAFAFDITHGLRSFPYLALLAAAYVQAGFGIPVQAVLYGAFEVRDTSVTPNVAPMFDLSPMLSLLQWATAADRFNRTGDARYLASLLRQQQKALAEIWRDQPERRDQLRALNNLAGALEDISQALRLIRPHRAMCKVAGLRQYIDRAEPVLQEAVAARPFVRLLEQVEQTYAPLGLADPKNQPRALAVEREMIGWYVERELWPQAAALAREWLVSWVMAHLGLGPETSSAERHRVESYINAEAEAFLQAKSKGRPFTPIFLRDVPAAEKMLGLWKNITDLRNDILHAGMRDKPGDPKNLISNLENRFKDLEELPLP